MGLSNEEREHLTFMSDLRQLLKLKHFNEFLWRVLEICEIYGVSSTGDNFTHILEGKRVVGVEILQMLEEADATAYARLLLDKRKSQQGQSQQEEEENA